MTDQLEDLFADLRADTITKVRPPGAAAVRRTVRRRRTTSSVAAAAAVIAVAGGGIVVLRRTVPEPAPVAPQPTTAADRLATTAQDQLSGFGGLQISDEHLLLKGPIPMTARGVGKGAFGTAANYNIYVACVGDGVVAVNVRTAPRNENGDPDNGRSKIIAHEQVTCEPFPTSQMISVKLTSAAFLYVNFDPDQDALGRSGVGLVVHRWIEATLESVHNRKNASRFLRAQVASRGRVPSEVTTETDTFGSESLSGPVTEPLLVVCLGPGTVTVEIFPGLVGVDGPARRAGDTLLRETLTCRSTSKVVSIPAKQLPPGYLVIGFYADAKARNHAGLAYLFPGE